MNHLIYKNNLECDFSHYISLVDESSRYENDTSNYIFCPEIEEVLQHDGNSNNSVNQICENLTKLTSEYVDTRDVELFSAWINVHLPGDNTPPHAHKIADFTTIYYIDIPAGSGDLYIQKPDGDIDKHTPKQYDFIAMPGDYVHATGRNKSSSNRVSLVADWHYKDTTKSKEIDQSFEVIVTKALNDLLKADGVKYTDWHHII